MLRRLSIVLFTIWAALAVLGPVQAAPVFPTGSRVGLEPAAGLKLSTHFAGFEDADRHVNVAILDLPAAAYDQITRSAFSVEQKGMTNVKREGFPFTGGMGVLVSADAKVNGQTVHHWFMAASPAAIKVPNLAVLIRVEVPEAARSIYTDAVVRKMLASVTFRQVPPDELLSLLPFKLTDLAGFKVTKVVPGGVVIAERAEAELDKQAYAIITIGSGGPQEPADRMRFARDLMVNAPVTGLSVTSAESMRTSGQPGNEIRAQAKGLHNEPIALVQWLRFVNGGFVRIVAVSPKDDWDKVFNRFRAVRDGITIRER